MRPPSDHVTRFAPAATAWRPRLQSVTATAAVATRTVVGHVAFWIAICLPVLILGLVGSGIETTGEARALVALIGLESGALVAGRAHLADREPVDDR